MTNYLYIDSKAFDDVAIINSLSCTHGRTDITQQPSPSTFRGQFQLAVGAVFPTPINLGSEINWSIYDPLATGLSRLIFSGKISDVQVSLQWSNGSGIYVYDVTAVDRLATLGNKTTASAFAKQYEGDRIAAVLSTWSYDTSGITTPGNYEIAVLASGTVNSGLELVQQAAQSAMGVVFCEPGNNNRVRYQTYLDRKSNPLITLSTGDILSGDYVLNTSTNTVVNQVTLTYGTGSAGTTYDDTTSQTTYGVRSGTRATTLHNVTDANNQAQTLLASRKAPAYSLANLTINTSILADSLRSQLTQVANGTRIQINGLPTPEVNSFYGFVEGYTWTAARGQELLTLNLSNYGQLYPYTLWQDLNSTDTWNTYALSTTTWSDIT